MVGGQEKVPGLQLLCLTSLTHACRANKIFLRANSYSTGAWHTSVWASVREPSTCTTGDSAKKKYERARSQRILADPPPSCRPRATSRTAQPSSAPMSANGIMDTAVSLKRELFTKLTTPAEQVGLLVIIVGSIGGIAQIMKSKETQDVSSFSPTFLACGLVCEIMLMGQGYLQKTSTTIVIRAITTLYTVYLLYLYMHQKTTASPPGAPVRTPGNAPSRGDATPRARAEQASMHQAVGSASSEGRVGSADSAGGVGRVVTAQPTRLRMGNAIDIYDWTSDLMEAKNMQAPSPAARA